MDAPYVVCLNYDCGKRIDDAYIQILVDGKPININECWDNDYPREKFPYALMLKFGEKSGIYARTFQMSLKCPHCLVTNNYSGNDFVYPEPKP